jgi:hypothetical protein
VERKRHIGNDIINIVFVDGGPEEMAREWLDTGLQEKHPISFLNLKELGILVNCRKNLSRKKI